MITKEYLRKVRGTYSSELSELRERINYLESKLKEIDNELFLEDKNGER